MNGPSVTEHLREQAGWCSKLGSPFTAELLLALKADLDAGGITDALIGSWPGNPRADALGLRLAGALHYAVLSGMSPDLKKVYPDSEAYPSFEFVWPVIEQFIRNNTGWVSDFIQSPPQTNETRRAFMLLAGLKAVAARFEKPIHFLELGASAGLNQNFDAFFYDAGHWQWGDPASPMKVTTEWNAPTPELNAPLIIHARKACDQNPIDVSAPGTRLQLKSYVWPDQPERLARFDAAADIAIARGTQVEKADAADWLERELMTRPEGMTSVVFHSVFFQYPPKETRSAIIELMEAAGQKADAASPLVWLRYEPANLWDRSKPLTAANMECDLRIWPGDEHLVLARSDGHVREVEAP